MAPISGGSRPRTGFRVLAEPIFDGDHVWAVTRDELGVERVVRYRILVGGDEGAGLPSFP